MGYPQNYFIHHVFNAFLYPQFQQGEVEGYFHVVLSKVDEWVNE